MFPGPHALFRAGLVTGVACLSVILFGCSLAGAAPGAAGEQRTVAWVEKMSRLPEPLIIRDWTQVSRKYYRLVLNSEHEIDGRQG